MALSHSPSIVTNGLVLCLDAGNPRSYPGSGTSWKDGSGSNTTGVLTNNPTYNSSNLGSIVLDGVDDYVSLGSFFNYQNFTISVWVNPGSTQVQYADIFDNSHTGTRNFVLQQDSTNTNVYGFGVHDAAGSISGVGGISLTANIWTNITMTFTPSDRAIVYVNGVFLNQGNLANNRNILYDSQSLDIGRWNLGGRNWNGKIASFVAYNRVLTAAEILQNYNALRGRYGI